MAPAQRAAIRPAIGAKMVLAVVGSLLIGIALPLLWWVRRMRTRSKSRRLTVAAATVGLVIGLVGIGVYLWAATATDTSQFARALLWGDSEFGDQDRFPSRSMAASADPISFQPVADSPVDAYAPDGSGNSLEQFLASAQTTAFVVIHDDDLLYEGYFNGSSRESIQTSFSVATSFTATLVGIAVAEGHIDDLDDPVTAYVPELAARDERFADVTLRHLITMSSGLWFKDGGSPWADPANDRPTNCSAEQAQHRTATRHGLPLQRPERHPPRRRAGQQACP